MQANSMSPALPSVQLPVMAVAELQDALLVVMHDLHRLEGLLNHAGDNLLERFSAVSLNLNASAEGDRAALEQVRSALQLAVTELQFQDMASQLILHTTKVVQGCAYRLAAQAMGGDEDEEPSDEVPTIERPNPVTQSEMDAGSIELF